MFLFWFSSYIFFLHIVLNITTCFLRICSPFLLFLLLFIVFFFFSPAGNLSVFLICLLLFLVFSVYQYFFLPNLLNILTYFYFPRLFTPFSVNFLHRFIFFLLTLLNILTYYFSSSLYSFFLPFLLYSLPSYSANYSYLSSSSLCVYYFSVPFLL